MQSTVKVTKAAPDVSLVGLHEAKIALKITGDSDDKLVELIVRRASSEVATYCNRVLVKEDVIETFRRLDECTQLFLARYPVKATDLKSVIANGSELSSGDYELDEESGRLTILSGTWTEPVVVTYAGGYAPPQGVPPALRQATLLYAREAYFATQRGDASIRMISHKETRVIYFDPNAANRAMGGAGGSAAQRAAKDLLSRFTRYAI